MITFQKLIDEYGRDSDIETMEHLTLKIDHFNNTETIKKIIKTVVVLK